MNVYKYFIIPEHAVIRFNERNVSNKDLKLFFRHVTDHFCEEVFDCCVYGLINGKAKKKILGNSTFIYTYDEYYRKIVLKTMWENK